MIFFIPRAKIYLFVSPNDAGDLVPFFALVSRLKRRVLMVYLVPEDIAFILIARN